MTLVKGVIVGFLIGESWYLSQVIANPIICGIEKLYSPLAILILSAGAMVLVVVYLYSRNSHRHLLKLVLSYRADILIAVMLGLALSVSFAGLGSAKYSQLVSALSLPQLLIMLSLPPTLALLLVMRALAACLARDTEKEPPFFISDVELKSKDDDLLGLSEPAERFAERVFNGGSSDSIVFGIDAPWGIGKSTFVNFCCEYWELKHKDHVIVYRFNPLRYEDRSNLLETFVDGLIRRIQKDAFVPEMRPLISRYSRLIKGKGTVSHMGLNVEIVPGTYTIDDAFEDLESALKDLKRKVIVVVDDLDRLSFSAVKHVLFAIKKSFTLPNISYVLCYDTENIAALQKDEEDAEKVREFLEKFVNVKISLFLDTSTLSKYISDNFERAVRNNLQLDPYTLGQLKDVMSAIQEIYNAPDFHNYQSLLGDIRKLKRLINTLVLFEIEKTDFENSDFNKQDLIHLLLIYINYPNVFRKIYTSETNGKKGFFSLLIPYDDGYPAQPGSGGQPPRMNDGHYANSNGYKQYVNGLPANPKFLLDKIFDASTRLDNTRIDDVPEEQKRSYACFNGDGGWRGGRNLEEYLNLIVKLSKPRKRGQYRFYLNAKDKVLSGVPIADILSDSEFAYSEGESGHEQFLRVVVNSARDFDRTVGSALIKYFLDHIQNYSLFTNTKIGIGLRDDINYFLIKLLDSAGWTDSDGLHVDNTEANIAEIAEWIFGEGRHANDGVIAALGREDKGALGLYDLMAFRLFCCADRGGDTFNLQRALSLHGSPTAPTQGMVRGIVIEEMRELSQRVFALFKSQYITPRRNLFQVIDGVSLQDSTGRFFEFIQNKLASGELTQDEVNKSLASLKSRMKAFIIYQLGNSIISQGIGCGYYDETGRADNKGIASSMNAYLFDECFNPDGREINYQHFLDYLLINFAQTFGSRGGGISFVPHIAEFTKVLDRNRLAQYWRDNRTIIRSFNFTQLDKTIETGNYSASYRRDLERVYQTLDNLLAELNRPDMPEASPGPSDEIGDARA